MMTKISVHACYEPQMIHQYDITILTCSFSSGQSLFIGLTLAVSYSLRCGPVTLLLVHLMSRKHSAICL